MPCHAPSPLGIYPCVHILALIACSQRQDDAFQRQYENEHTWEALQEDEYGNLRVVRWG